MELKTYYVDFIYKDGNGWAIVNAYRPSQIASILKNNSRFEDIQVIDYRERKCFGNTMSIVYEGAVSSFSPVDITPYDLAVKNGFKGTEEEWLKTLVGPKGDAPTWDDFSEEQKQEIYEGIEQAVSEKGVYLPITAGTNNPLTGPLYMNISGSGPDFLFLPFNKGFSSVLFRDSDDALSIGSSEGDLNFRVRIKKDSSGTVIPPEIRINNSYLLYHSGNISSVLSKAMESYLPLSGGTLTGSLNLNSKALNWASGYEAIALAGGKLSFGNVNQTTQIRSSGDLTHTTKSYVSTVWDSYNLPFSQSGLNVEHDALVMDQYHLLSAGADSTSTSKISRITLGELGGTNNVVFNAQGSLVRTFTAKSGGTIVTKEATILDNYNVATLGPLKLNDGVELSLTTTQGYDIEQIITTLDRTDTGYDDYMQDRQTSDTNLATIGVVGDLMDTRQENIKIETTTTNPLKVDTYYRLDDAVNTLTLNLPSMASTHKKVESIIVNFTTGNSPNIKIVAAGNKTVSYYKGYNIEANTTYELNIIYNGLKWVVAYAVIE